MYWVTFKPAELSKGWLLIFYRLKGFKWILTADLSKILLAESSKGWLVGWLLSSWTLYRMLAELSTGWLSLAEYSKVWPLTTKSTEMKSLKDDF